MHLLSFFTAASLAWSVSAATVNTTKPQIVPPGQRGTPFNGIIQNKLDLTGTQTPAKIFTSAFVTAQQASLGPTLQSAAISTASTSTKIPDGYKLVFGPIGGANNAPGFMGAVSLLTYDPNLCAQQCNKRNADSNGGACQYFNIWQGVVNGTTVGVTCSMYFLVADQSTAVNTGQGDLQVTQSRGFSRTNLVVDGGFEGFNSCTDFCVTSTDSAWIGTSSTGGTDDASIFFFQPFARSGNAVALLGSANNLDSLPGTMTQRKGLPTIRGRSYSINLFQSSSFSSPEDEANAHVDVLWNGKVVLSFGGFSQYTFEQVTVTAAGNDKLAFRGGAAPAWTMIDDVAVFQA